MTRKTVAIMVVAIACGLAVCGLEVIYVASLRAPNTDFDKLADRFMKPGLKRGEQLTCENLLDPDANPLKNGMTILALPISVEEMPFFLLPGTEVDLVQTVAGQTKVFVRQVPVIAVDCTTRSPRIRGTALLQLDPAQSRNVAVAKEWGTVSFILRPKEP